MFNQINIIQKGTQYQISFHYDPQIVAFLKLVPSHAWNPDKKLWTIDSQYLGLFLNQLKGTVYEAITYIHSEEQIDVNAELGTTSTIPDYSVNLKPLNLKSDPYDHQVDFVKWSLYREQVQHNKNGELLADTPGCGKTFESTILALCNKEIYHFKHCLIIVCLNSAKYNWFNDIKKFTHEAPYILGSRIKKRTGQIEYNGGSKEKYDDLMNETMYGMDEPLPYFIIMNIEAIRYGQGKKHLMMELISHKINSGEIGMIMIDEIHKNASMTSQQGKMLQQIKKNTGNRCIWVPMTGTPITSRPLDLYLPMFLIGAHNQTSFYKWKQFYCVYGGYGDHEVIAYKNIPQLKQMLAPNMIRRTREQVLDLPPKIHMTEYVDLSPYQIKLYNNVANGLIQNKDHIIHELNPMTEILKLRQAAEAPELVDNTLDYRDSGYLTKNARLQRLLELVDDIVSNGEKGIIFSNWVMPLHHVYYYLRKRGIKTAVYTGTMSQEDREKQKNMFMTNPECKIIIGTIGAMGVSHTLTVATNVIFYDDPWDNATKSQAEDRAYRIGTTHSVNVYTIVARNTVDERVERILEKKKNISGFIVDSNLDIMNNPELFDYLLGSDMKVPDES